MRLYKRQRLVLALVALLLLGGATTLVLTAMGESIAYFATPTEVSERQVEPGRRLRIGGLVVDGSVVRGADGTVQFRLTDTNAEVPVAYKGLLPDLFREGQGIVAQGAVGRRRHLHGRRGLGQARRALHAQGSRRQPQGAGRLERGPERDPERERIMIAELGHYALVLAFALAIVQGTLPLWGASRRDAALMALAPSAAVAQFFCIAVAFGALMHAYVVSDFSVLNVAANSHVAKPLIYKISGVWANHEGSLVLWVLVLSLFGALIALMGKNLPAPFKARTLAVQGLIGVGFLAFMLFTSNPFLRLDPAPFEGQGLNPILQDPGLAFHPPMLYLGYVGFSTAFSFAMAALIEGRIDPTWARWVRPWTLVAWMALTLGIGLGSWWAYYELGWGGFWFWDPVENASFMPWLAGTALVHSTIVVEKRDTLKAWTILLAILAFSLSLLGTFLVRSGVLTSVHASPPTRRAASSS